MGRRICVVGSSNMDLVTRIARLPDAGETLIADGFATSPGGKGANQATAAALNGADVTFVTRVGDDAFGRDLPWTRRRPATRRCTARSRAPLRGRPCTRSSSPARRRSPSCSSLRPARCGARGTGTGRFGAAKRWAQAAATLAFLLYFLGFMGGGEWLAMWRSSQWNMQAPAFRIVVVVMVVLVYLDRSDGA